MSKQAILPRCLPVYPLKERIKGVFWGVTSGIFTAIGCGWMTDAPWFWQRVEKLISWLPF